MGKGKKEGRTQMKRKKKEARNKRDDMIGTKRREPKRERRRSIASYFLFFFCFFFSYRRREVHKQQNAKVILGMHARDAINRRLPIHEGLREQVHRGRIEAFHFFDHCVSRRAKCN